MTFPNASITPEGYSTLVSAMRHEWAAADGLNADERIEAVRTALGFLPTITTPALLERATAAASILDLIEQHAWDQTPVLPEGIEIACENSGARR